MALLLYCARLVDEQHTGDPATADDARLLLEVLTPVAKSWPSEFCLEANSLAIQAHGGGGMCDDFPLAYAYAGARTLRFADGPDEVHRNAIAKWELGKYAPGKTEAEVPVTRF